MSESKHPKYKILLVDDDLDANNTVAWMLEFDGHEVRTVNSSEAALALLAKSRFDLIITEYWLPSMKGDELAAIIKQEYPDHPIILMAANSEEINADAHPFAGVDCLVSKSFSLVQLREAMIWVFDRYAGRRRSGKGTFGGDAQPQAPDSSRSTLKDTSSSEVHH
jgi:CheY-like chemotaxis protein